MRFALNVRLAALCLLVASATVLNGQYITPEVEPNNDFTMPQALTLVSGSARLRGNIFPNGDLDFYSFSGNTGDRVFAATMTSGSATGSTDSLLQLIAPDGTTIIEADDNDGSFGGSSSSIAGATLTSTGTHYLRVTHTSPTNQLRFYDLYLRVVPAATVFAAESEPNNDLASATVLGADLVASGSVNPAADVDYFAIDLNAGDTVFLSLDLDPERDGTTFNGRLGIGPLGGVILVANDASVISPNSEAHFYTVATAGTYYIYVDDATATGSATHTYRLAVAVFPDVTIGTRIVYSSTSTPEAIPTNAGGLVQNTVTVPDDRRIGRLAVALSITHATVADLDIWLTSPSGTNVHLATDVGGATGMSCILDEYAGNVVGSFTILQNAWLQPELSGRLSWFNGMSSAGTWTLNIAVDFAGAGGTLDFWALIIEDEPIPALSVAPYTLQTVFSSDFEANDGGFTHSGTQDEWERGTPTFAPIISAFSGTNCWCTDLDNTYNASSDQTLVSPPIDLTNYVAPIRARWAMAHQMESASFDTLRIVVREVGNPSFAVTLYTWLGATQTLSAGSPGATIQQSLGWGQFYGDISALAGLTVEFVVQLTSDTTVQYAGVAIDDVMIEGALNQAPVYTPPAGNVIRGQQSGANDSNIGTISDAETPATSMGLIIISAAPTGVTFGTPYANVSGALMLPITMSMAAVIGTYPIDLIIVDGDGGLDSGQFILEVVAGTAGIANNPPVYTPPAGNVIRGQESGSNGSTIGTVSDVETPAASLVVAITSAAPTGITFGTPTVNASGVVTLPITMTTAAVIGTYPIDLTVTDGDSAVTNGQFILEVVAGGAGGGGGKKKGGGGDDKKCSADGGSSWQWLAVPGLLAVLALRRRRTARA